MKQKLIAVCSACGSPVEYDDGDEFAYCPMCENDQVEIAKRTHKPKTFLEKYVSEAVIYENNTKTDLTIGDTVVCRDSGKHKIFEVTEINPYGDGFMVEFVEVQDLPELDF